MPTIKNLRWMYRIVFATSFLLLGFGFEYGTIARTYASSGLGPISGAYVAAASAFSMAGLLGGMVAGALKLIVRHIELLEAGLAALVTGDVDPKKAAKALNKFLRAIRPTGKTEFAKAMHAAGDVTGRIFK